MATKPMLVLGLMSGTSADGIDVALARISGAPPNLRAKLLGHVSVTLPSALRKEILRVAEQDSVTAGDLSQLTFRLGKHSRTPRSLLAAVFVFHRSASH